MSTKMSLTPSADQVGKALGIIIPIRAQDTGLVPEGWGVRKDRLEGRVELAKLNYLSGCFVKAPEIYVSGEIMTKRALELGAIGSLGLAAGLLEAQKKGKIIFPVESGVKKHNFVMPCTELDDEGGDASVAYFYWNRCGGGWKLGLRSLVGYFYPRDRFLRFSD
ncbi:MAG: hypothetical protein U1C57_02995 [Candidatus Doudnabacteria bacterium]|nr:hypothetical protein [bacterium]MDZ4244047.1 hypothetical protein [Candidatus Doudnabacteria bacterium]